MKLFVPGRICLFGEHTDWAGGYRRINGAIEKGYLYPPQGPGLGIELNQELVKRYHPSNTDTVVVEG